MSKQGAKRKEGEGIGKKEEEKKRKPSQRSNRFGPGHHYFLDIRGREEQKKRNVQPAQHRSWWISIGRYYGIPPPPPPLQQLPLPPPLSLLRTTRYVHYVRDKLKATMYTTPRVTHWSTLTRPRGPQPGHSRHTSPTQHQKGYKQGMSLTQIRVGSSPSAQVLATSIPSHLPQGYMAISQYLLSTTWSQARGEGHGGMALTHFSSRWTDYTSDDDSSLSPTLVENDQKKTQNKQNKPSGQAKARDDLRQKYCSSCCCRCCC